MNKCTHHWHLGASHNGIVHARCRKCHAERDFSNIPVFLPGTVRSRRHSSQLQDGDRTV